MALVHKCPRCHRTDPGTDDQREGQQPPSNWLRVRIPTSSVLDSPSREDTLCELCKSDFYSWIHAGKKWE